MSRNRAAEIARAVAACDVDRRRFATAVRDGLTAAELAERFDISRHLATHLRKAMRRA